MKKITFLMLHLNYGGIERQVTTLANNLSDEYEIEIISLYDLLGKSFYDLDDRIKVRYILPYGPNKKEIVHTIKKVNLVTLAKEIKKAIKILYEKYMGIGKLVNTLETDVIISSRIEFSKQIKREDILAISQEHSYIDTNRYISKVKRSFKHIKYLVIMTNMAKQKYDLWLKNQIKKPQVIVIPNITDEVYTESNLENKQIIGIGRLEDIKDFDSLIDIFKIVNERNPEWKLKICGEGNKREDLEKKIAKLDLKDKVILTGRLTINAVNEEIKNSSIFVLTSKSESFSLSITACMSYGLPCVSFDIDVGPREIIADKEDGFLIKDRNNMAMAEKICLLIENEELRKQMGKKAKENVARFYPKNILKEWKKILK